MKRKAISCLLMLAAVMTLTPGIPTLAAETEQTQVQETQDVTSVGTKSTTITYQQDSAFTVTIPKTITLDQNKSASYNVNVKGDIAGNETITVTPDATVQLEDSNGKAAVTGDITQETTEFAATEVNQEEGSNTTGNIVANDLTAGNWSGNFEFAIDINEKKELQAGLYDENGIMLCSWEDSGVDIEQNQTGSSYNTDSKAMYYVITNKYPKTKTVILPDNVTKLGVGAFAFCSDITNVVMPDSVTSISSGSFSGCSNLETIVIPNSVVNIDNIAFSNCSNLTNITIPKSVANIGSDIFSECGSLSFITVDINNPVYDSRNNCNAIIETASNKLIAGCKNTVIPDSVTSIGEDAFAFCSELTSIVIPDSVTYIDQGAFQDCSNLANVFYKGAVYVNETDLKSALTNNGVTVNSFAFDGTALQ